MALPGYCTYARGRNSRGALAHSRGTLWGTVAEGVLGAILYCGALDGLFSALQGFKAVRRGTQGVLRGPMGY
jgi:hypothetical protein